MNGDACHSITSEAIKTNEQSNDELVDPKFRKVLRASYVYCHGTIISFRLCLGDCLLPLTGFRVDS